MCVYLHLYALKSVRLPTRFKICSFRGFVASASDSVETEGLSLENGELLYWKRNHGAAKF